ncbi:hypothetical protein R5G_10350 [Escherichia coli]|uniref:Uncharacterized protein n=1 Tax=Escherichia coli TaxID=562 RepID=W0S140_ECOLX|nr:hypothetical protein [Escherichia coli]BAO24303.1 hypothetical protein [Escherichia coli]BAO24400.1 hypothetical protein [Escherichia coli]BAO24497.1 hypothetical protein [Escherichia coli]BAO24592.1 hypothetical protein [Escherichia coli]
MTVNPLICGSKLLSSGLIVQLIETLPTLNISVPATLLRFYNADSACATVVLTVKTTAKRMFNSFMRFLPKIK